MPGANGGSAAGEHTATMKAPIGFIGLGNIGAPMAARLLEWPHGLVVFDLDAEAAASLGDRGARVASSAAEVASEAGLVCVMVNTEDQVRSVLESPGGVLEGARTREGTPPVVAVHSTISPSGAVELAALAAGGGVELLDVPVSGGSMGAHAGTLALLVGGDPAAFERVREPLGLMGSLVRHFGPVGAGTTAKVVRNLITFASFAAAGESARLAEASGLDLVALGEVVRHSDAVTGGPGAVMLRDTAVPMAPEDPLRPIFEHSGALGHKDLELALDLAASLGLAAPVAEVALENLAPALGLVDRDDPPEVP